MLRAPAFRKCMNAGIAVCALAMATGSASALELSPVTVILSEAKPIGSVVLRNEKDRPAAFELEGLKWSQRDGRDIHTVDSDLIVTPPIVSLAPGESILVRVGLLSTAPDAVAEDSYRLKILDISSLEETRTPLKIRTQVLMPVFVRPAESVEDIVSTLATDREGRTCLFLENNGNVHQKLVSVASRSDASQSVAVQQYVLAGGKGRVCPKALGEELAGVSLKAGFTSAYTNKVTYHDVSEFPSGAQVRASR